MIIDDIREELFRLQDVQYRDFQSKLIPTVPPGSFIGVRTPALRKLAKDLGKRPDIGEFLDALPHLYFDENQLHAFLLSEMKDYSACLTAVNRFLPFVDNWATCDQMSYSGSSGGSCLIPFAGGSLRVKPIPFASECGC